jgi:hypothetical protein
MNKEPTVEDKIAGLSPAVRARARAIIEELNAAGWQAFVAEGRRTWEQQKEKVAKGYSKTMHSKHLTGLAADIVDRRYLWEKVCPKRFWLELGSAAVRHGLRWGGSFGLEPKEWAALRSALLKRDFKAALDMKIGWDPAHVEVAG